jgi:hypothetical protein
MKQDRFNDPKNVLIDLKFTDFSINFLICNKKLSYSLSNFTLL